MAWQFISSQTSNDAPDNPGTIPEVERLSSIGDDPIALRRSPRLRRTEAGIVKNNSKQNTNEFGVLYTPPHLPMDSMSSMSSP